MISRMGLKFLQKVEKSASIHGDTHTALSTNMTHAKLGKLFGPFIGNISPSGAHDHIREAAFPSFNNSGISTNAIGQFLIDSSMDGRVVFYTPTPPTYVIMDTPSASVVAWSEAPIKEHVAISGDGDGAKIHDGELVEDIQNKIREALPLFPEDIQNIYKILMEESIGSSSNDSRPKL